LRTIRLIWVGKPADSFVREATDKYLKLLKPYARIETVELKEGRDRDRGALKKREGQRIMEKTASFVLLDEKGGGMTSRDFAAFLDGLLADPVPRDFVIGGAFGVSEDVRRSNMLGMFIPRGDQTPFILGGRNPSAQTSIDVGDHHARTLQQCQPTIRKLSLLDQPASR